MLSLCIQNIYLFAHEIIIVEGATRATTHYWDGNTQTLTSDGTSTDNTIQYIKNIPDPDNKIRLIESNGFWNGKTEMCNEYSQIATGDYIWQLDSDEFWKHDDIVKIVSMLENKSPYAMHFFANHFYGDFNHCIDERGDGMWGNDIPWKRIFKHIPKKSKWISHEPPSYMCNNVICNDADIIDKYQTLNAGIKIYHYSYVARSQAMFKDIFFNQSYNLKEWDEFQTSKNTLAHGSKVYKFEGEHPSIIKSYYNL